ncbi:MAG: excinuclease ABC subunit UvrA [Candidatus Aureabacteria bacterium]|nr:excinuclease ABC subunit UvrA [Candidatus Auribacterota bacterium]
MDKIIIRGARQHNLKGVDLELPRNRLIVITGVSGSGKSSLALDTIYAEGQRKYVESLSAYARQFLEQMQKPDVDHIEGLSPAIAIQQRPLGATPRSTVATATEIHDYLRVLYSRLGVPHCVRCGKPLRRRTVQEMVDELLGWGEGTHFHLLARMVEGARGTHAELLGRLAQEGFIRVRIDGALSELAKVGKLNARKAHTIDLVIDRLTVSGKIKNRLTDSMELALRMGEGRALAVRTSPPAETVFTERMLCPDCGLSYADLGPAGFSFNSPHGACPACHGLGRRLVFDLDLVIDPRRTVAAGGIAPLRYGGRSLIIYYKSLLRAVARHYGFSLDVPFKKLEKRWQEILLGGSGDEPITLRYWRGRRPFVRKAPFEGIINNLERRFRQSESAYVRGKLQEFMRESTCEACGGRRLRAEALAVTVAGKSISDFTSMAVSDALAFVGGIQLDSRGRLVGADLLREIGERLGFLEYVGLDYLALDRESSTLSGGEGQRTRLATQIGAGLVGVLYVLDEPSIGLHLRDNERLLQTLMKLRDQGNTVIVIEHDEATIRAADHVVDLGPGAGVHGGRVVAQGTVEQLIDAPDSLTGRYLSGEHFISVPERRRAIAPSRRLEILGASHNNLKDIDVRIPIGLFCVVTGVSGAGKSSLVDDTLRRALDRELYGSRPIPGKHRGLKGLEMIDKVIVIDQSPIGRTPRSNPATYTGIYTHIRDLFARHPDSKARGYGPGRFSFNVKGGRCEACRGDGLLKVEMHFLPDVYVTCEACGGRRYNRETLEIRFKGKNIADVLEMTVDEALLFFRNIPVLARRLGVLNDVGLSYIKLGQSATTLSGGEAQRVKLARELGMVATGRTLYILDEPTTGLHFADIHKLLDVLQRLVGAGNTVLVVEHNMEVIKCADWVIDLGPEGGEEGGFIVAEGPPELIASCERSHTGRYLKKYLG